MRTSDKLLYFLSAILFLIACNNRVHEIKNINNIPKVALMFEFEDSSRLVADFNTADNFLADRPDEHGLKHQSGFRRIDLSDKLLFTVVLENIFGNKVLRLKFFNDDKLCKFNSIYTGHYNIERAKIYFIDNNLMAYFKLYHNSEIRTLLYQYDFANDREFISSDDGYTKWN